MKNRNPYKTVKKVWNNLKSRLDRREVLTQISRANPTPNPNETWTDGIYTWIKLTQGKAARILTVDYPLIASLRWTAQKYRNGIYYATAVILKRDRHGTPVISGRNEKGEKKYKQLIVLMHRLLTNFPLNLVIDHADYDGLNNARENISVVTNQENVSRRRPSKSHKSGSFSSSFRGVCWSKKMRKWQAQIFMGKRKYLGCFEDERDAAKAWNLAALDIYGKGAFQNAIA